MIKMLKSKSKSDFFIMLRDMNATAQLCRVLSWNISVFYMIRLIIVSSIQDTFDWMILRKIKWEVNILFILLFAD